MIEAERSNAVRAHGGRNNKRLRVVKLEWREGSVGAFDYGRGSLHKVEDVECSACVVRYGLVKPVTARFDEFQFVQARAFFAPAFA